MNEQLTSSQSTPHLPSPRLTFFLHGDGMIERDTLCYVAASALDVVMTWLLLTYDGGSDRVGFIESNPVARYFLYGWGIAGLVYFKVATVGLVILVCHIIARKRIDVAHRIMQFATLVVTLVVVYSISLLVRHT